MPGIPDINHQRIVKAFIKTGFWITRQGKHITMTNWKGFSPYQEGIRLTHSQWQEL